MAQKGEKSPWRASKRGLPPSSPCLHWPRKASPGKSIPREGHSPGKSVPREKGDAANKSTAPGVWRRRALSSREKPSRPGKKLRERMERKEGREDGRKVASQQAPPDFPKEPAQHSQPAAPRRAKRKEKALPRPGAEMSKTFRGRADETKGGVNTGTAHGTESKPHVSHQIRQRDGFEITAAAWSDGRKPQTTTFPGTRCSHTGGVLGYAEDRPCHWGFLGF